MNALPLRLIFALLVFVFPGSSGAYEPSYVSVGQVDFAKILPPSPPKDFRNNKMILMRCFERRLRGHPPKLTALSGTMHFPPSR